MKLNYQIVVAKINGNARILMANDLGTCEDDCFLYAEDIYKNKYNLLWEINGKRIELYLNDILLTPLHQYLKDNNLFTFFEKNDHITYQQIENIQNKITSIENSKQEISL